MTNTKIDKATKLAAQQRAWDNYQLAPAVYRAEQAAAVTDSAAVEVAK